MSWEDIIKEKKVFRGGGAQKDFRVEYLNKEFDNDIATLDNLLANLPSNLFKDMKNEFQELLKKYELVKNE
tara:strand:- start:435 stop:647 length:213 start_codon:yes stop_codon:yes gene_type:complete